MRTIMGAGLKYPRRAKILQGVWHSKQNVDKTFLLNDPATINVSFFSRIIAYLRYLRKRFELSWRVLLVIGLLVVLTAVLSYWL